MCNFEHLNHVTSYPTIAQTGQLKHPQSFLIRYIRHSNNALSIIPLDIFYKVNIFYSVRAPDCVSIFLYWSDQGFTKRDHDFSTFIRDRPHQHVTYISCFSYSAFDVFNKIKLIIHIYPKIFLTICCG